MKKIFLGILFLSGFLLAETTLPVYAGASPDTRILGYLNYSDSISDLPIPAKRKKIVKYVRKRGSKQKKKVVKYVTENALKPPEYVPVQTKFSKKGYVRRADLARFREGASDLSGIYSSNTGRVLLLKSPNSPGRFNLIIQNGPAGSAAEISAGDLPQESVGNHTRFHYAEPGCVVDVDLAKRKVRVAQKGCEEYNVGEYTLSGTYDHYGEYKRRAEVFREPERRSKFGKFVWCPEGPSSCEKTKDESGESVQIVWSAGGEGFIERRAGDRVHKYRPFERMIPHRNDFYKGEKPEMLKTKRVDMANEWMVWYYYPKAERYKMVRLGTRADAAYMEIYE